MQLYVDRNRPKTEKLLDMINGLGMKAIFVTVDAAAPGKREADERSRAEIEVVSVLSFVLPSQLLCEVDWVGGYRRNSCVRVMEADNAGVWYIWWKDCERQTRWWNRKIRRRVHRP